MPAAAPITKGEMMNEEQLQAIEERANKATPGPWEEVAESSEWWIAGPDTDSNFVMSTNASENILQSDIDFIAHARADVPALIAEVRRLRAKLATVQVYARGIYGEVPPISFEDWYALVQGEPQP